MQKRTGLEQQRLAAQTKMVFSATSFFKEGKPKSMALAQAPPDEQKQALLSKTVPRKKFMAETMEQSLNFLVTHSEQIDARVKVLIEQNKGPAEMEFSAAELNVVRRNANVLYYYFHYLLPEMMTLLVEKSEESNAPQKEKLDEALRALENATVEFSTLYHQYSSFSIVNSSFSEFLDHIMVLKQELDKLKLNGDDEGAKQAFHARLAVFHTKYKMPQGDKGEILGSLYMGFCVGLALSIFTAMPFLILSDPTGSLALLSLTVGTALAITAAVLTIVSCIGASAYLGWQSYNESIARSSAFAAEVETFNNAISAVVPAPVLGM